MTIKAVIFDAGGVLHTSNGNVASELNRTLGISGEKAKAILSKYIPAIGVGKLSEQQVWDEVSQDYKIRKVAASEDLLTRSFIKTLRKIPEMYELIDELKVRGLKVALLTNVTPRFAEVLEAAGHYDPFDVKILSYEAGFWKPDPKIYKYTLEKLGIKPGEAIFVDDLLGNVEAASKLGINAILFKTPKQVKQEVMTLIS